MDLAMYEKLPAWARREFTKLQGELHVAQQELAAFTGKYAGSNLLLRYGLSTVPLPADRDVRWGFPSLGEGIHAHCHIDVSFRGDPARPGPYLRVAGSHSLVVRPWVTNVVHIGLER